MAITFTSTRVGSSADYMLYLQGELKKTDRYKDSTLLDFALAPTDANYVHLDRGAYIAISSTTYPEWFTGFIINEPEATFLGDKGNKTPVWGYTYQATSDEYILSMKPLGVIQPFLNMTMGAILKALAEMIAPGLFDYTNIQDGPLLAQYQVEPDKQFKDVFKDLCDAAGYIFYGRSLKLYFLPQDDASLTVLTLDGTDENTTHANLSVKPSTSPILNDITVLGQLEPQTYMHEYFVGTGLEAAFPLTAGVWGADTALLLQDQFTGTLIDETIWKVFPDNTQGFLSIFDNYLQCTGGNGSPDVWLQSVSAIPMDGRLRLTHGEWDFVTGGSGVLGGLWTQAPNGSYTGCLYGLQMSGTTLNPIVAGAVDTTQFVTVSTSMRYVLRTVVEFTKCARIPQEYSYLDSNGVLQTVTASTQPDDAIWQTIISEVDPTTGVVTKQFAWKNTSVLTGTGDAFAVYVPILTSSIDATVGNISISIPVHATLEVASSVPLYNGTFDDWDDSTHPSGWINPANVAEEQIWSAASNDIKFLGAGATVEQDVSLLIQPGLIYNIIFQAERNVSSSGGTLSFRLYGTGLTPVGPDFDIASLNDTYTTYSAKLTDALTTIPVDCKLQITASGGPCWVDSLTILSQFQHQLVGPNEMDAMDGLAPVATVVAGNVNSQTKSTYTGAPQFNPGQDQLVFFKNSVTFQSSTPPENQIVRFSYRAAGSAVGRVQSAASIATEMALYNDDGVRSVVRTDLNPRPRTSLECELAAKALVSENAFQHYEGTYKQFSPYFTKEPVAGQPIKFVNFPGIPFLLAEEVQQVQTTALCDHPVEYFLHEITFGKPDHIQTLISKFQEPVDSFAQSVNTPYSDPGFVDVTDVGLNYLPDVTRPILINWDDTYIYLDMGQDLDAAATTFEVRFTDEGWSSTVDGKNLALRTTGRAFRIARNRRGRLFFVRQTASGITSRYSACVHVAFPTPASNSYIRDWEARVIDTASPLVVGTDLQQNRYLCTVEKGTHVVLYEWSATLKTLGSATLDVLKSSDLGLTWESVFPIDPKPSVASPAALGRGTQFQNRFIERGDMLRYDCLIADGTGGGLELTLKGRVYTEGDLPVGTANATGTGGFIS
jgi:hypothetical protein